MIHSFLLAATLASPPPPSDVALKAALAALVDDAAAKDGFSGAVRVERAGNVLFRGAKGLASRETRTPNTPETKFNLGSIDKAFTRLAVEQLAAEGRLSLSDPIGNHVAGLPEATARVTLQQLIDHRGGTGDVFGPRYDAVDRMTLRELRDWLPLFADRPLEFEPGTSQRYSNAGYILLGLAIEKVTGRAYRDHVRERIFAPAGMADTAPYAVDAAVANRATGYTDGSGALSDNRATLPWRGSSAGGGYSTVDDLAKFADALRAGRLGRRVDAFGIAGGAPGVNAGLEIAGADTIVVLANLDPPAANRLAESLRKALGHEDGGGRRMRRVGAGAAPSGPMAAPAKTVLPTTGVTLPMRRYGHLPAVEVMVDGKGPFLFAIDTGAAGTARIDAALAAKLGLAQVGEARGGGGRGRDRVHAGPRRAHDPDYRRRARLRGARGLRLPGRPLAAGEREHPSPADGSAGRRRPRADGEQHVRGEGRRPRRRGRGRPHRAGAAGARVPAPVPQRERRREGAGRARRHLRPEEQAHEPGPPGALIGRQTGAWRLGRRGGTVSRRRFHAPRRTCDRAVGNAGDRRGRR